MVASKYAFIFGLSVSLFVIHMIRCDSTSSNVQSKVSTSDSERQISSSAFKTASTSPAKALTVAAGNGTMSITDESISPETDGSVPPIIDEERNDTQTNTSSPEIDLPFIIGDKPEPGATGNVTISTNDLEEPETIGSTNPLTDESYSKSSGANSTAAYLPTIDDPKAKKKDKDGLKPGWYVLIFVSIGVFIFILIIVIVIVCRRRNQSKQSDETKPPEAAAQEAESPQIMNEEVSKDTPMLSLSPEPMPSQVQQSQSIYNAPLPVPKEKSRKEKSARETLMSAREAQSATREPPKQSSLRKSQKSLQMSKTPPPKEAPKSKVVAAILLKKYLPPPPPKVAKETSSEGSSHTSASSSTSSVSSIGSASTQGSSEREILLQKAITLSGSKTASKNVLLSSVTLKGTTLSQAPSSKGSVRASYKAVSVSAQSNTRKSAKSAKK